LNGGDGGSGGGWLRPAIQVLAGGLGTGFALSVLSAGVGSFSSSWIPTPGPSGLVGGWPLAFVEYDADVSEQFSLPSGTFLIPGRGLPISLGEVYLGFFLANALVLSVLAVFVLSLVSVALWLR
jgi:hypothetical protein